MHRKLSAFTIAILGLSLAGCSPADQSGQGPDLTELANKYGDSTDSLVESLDHFEAEGCLWGYEFVTSPNTTCYGIMNSIPAKAETLASSMYFASNSDLPGADSELVASTSAAANVLAAFRGDASEADSFAEASGEISELSTQWHGLMTE